MKLSTTSILTGLLVLGGAAAAQQDWRPSYTTYGTPGLIEMPSGQSDPSGQFTLSYGAFDLQQRSTLSFQISDRLGGSFRYSVLDQFGGPDKGETYDRSFDVRYRILNEGRMSPAVTVGLQDFLGTGRYSAEYVAATKSFGPSLRVTAGLGWGRFGSQAPFDNPLGAVAERFEERPLQESGELDDGEGGTVSDDQFFRGDASFFGGVEYRATDRLTAIVEYSGDAYALEDRRGTFSPSSPYNFGLVYKPRDEYQLSAAVLQGETLALSAHFSVNPANRPSFGRQDPAPLPVAVRPADARAAQSWDQSPATEARLRRLIVTGLAAEGADVTGVELGPRSVRIRYINTRYRTEAQMMGRINRILTQVLPPSIEAISLEPERMGVPVSAATFRRTDIEALENEVGQTELSYARTEIADAARGGAGLVETRDPSERFQWGIIPFFAPRYFDPDYPIYASIGLQATASYAIRPNLILAGSARYRVFGDRGEDLVSDGALPPVRTNSNEYHREGNPGIQTLTLSHYGRPAANLYSRVSVGYLEQMYGGLSTELLWKPVDSRLAVGAELNYARKRDFDLLFGFRDYDVWTGHASAYYDLGNGFHTQVDAGRYLAGDWGATFALDREFANGWRVGAYFTRTDVSFEDFGQGSFSKGLRLTIPTDWTIGTPTRNTFSTNLASLLRNGGARLEIEDRLYEVVREVHAPSMEQTWGRYWR